MFGEGKNLAGCGSAMPIEVRCLTVTENLVNERDRLTSRLATINEALAALQANPDIEKVINLVSRVHY